jgi:hypothetical protein
MDEHESSCQQRVVFIKSDISLSYHSLPPPAGLVAIRPGRDD